VNATKDTVITTRSRDATTTTDEQTPRLQRFIRQADLPSYVGLRRTQIAELIKAGEFPKPIPISDSGRAIAWLESEVLAWQAKRIAKRETA
jgi:prophage regulatory protein